MVAKGQKEPRWVVAFLRALERTGEAREAALDAGVDHSTAYARRRAHGEFAQAWREALAAHRARVAAEEEAEIAGVKGGTWAGGPSTISSSRNGPPPRAGEDLIVSGGKVRRVGHGRWSAAKEKLFFETLAVTASLRMAADAIGMSTNAILARRHNKPLFAAKFDAVAQNAQAGIDLFLAHEAKKAFDPETLEGGDAEPKLTIDQAIKIRQLNARRRKEEQPPDPFAEEAPSEEDAAALREKIVRKLQRLRERDRPDKLADGWTYDESYDLDIPPGYVKGPDYKPKPPEEPIDFNDRYR